MMASIHGNPVRPSCQALRCAAAVADRDGDDGDDGDDDDDDDDDDDNDDNNDNNDDDNNNDNNNDNNDDDNDNDNDDDDDIFIDTNKNIQECITKLRRFICLLGLNDRVFEACKTILIYIENKKILEKHTPLSRTSTIIYYVVERLDITVNKYNILQTCEISQVTINKCYQKLMKYKIELDNIDI